MYPIVSFLSKLTLDGNDYEKMSCVYISSNQNTIICKSSRLVNDDRRIFVFILHYSPSKPALNGTDCEKISCVDIAPQQIVSVQARG